MTQEDLNNIIELHRAWLKEEDDGEQANLVLEELDGLVISNADLSRSSFCGVSFKGCEITNSIFDDSQITECDFSNTFIENTRFDGSLMYDCVFKDATLLTCSYYCTDLNNSSFESCSTQAVSLQTASLGEVVFFNTNSDGLLLDELLETAPSIDE